MGKVIYSKIFIRTIEEIDKSPGLARRDMERIMNKLYGEYWDMIPNLWMKIRTIRVLVQFLRNTKWNGYQWLKKKLNEEYLYKIFTGSEFEEILNEVWNYLVERGEIKWKDIETKK